MQRSPVGRCGALARQWLPNLSEVPYEAPRLRIMHLNTLADCLAKSAPVLSNNRGFRCEPAALQWGHRSALLRQELLKHDCDIISLCEVDHFEDFFEPELSREGYVGTFKRKRSPAKDGVAIFWREQRLEEGLRRAVYLEHGGNRRTKGQQVALLQRLRLTFGPTGPAKSIVVCATHLRASADDAHRMRQASEVVSALAGFSRGDPQVVLADVNSCAPLEAPFAGPPSGAFDYFAACGYRCAYRSVGHRLPSFTTWAGWASGDFRAVCDHIFVKGPVEVMAVLDVPDSATFEAEFPERLPNGYFPSDHMSLVVDLGFP
mmetsp:Transcript_35702/g.70683  ORF Transcript_35702/g.70683 Transcript_35702/m.70683 type:complete len:318 (+) Transcript_35702:117-1070(+)